MAREVEKEKTTNERIHGCIRDSASATRAEGLSRQKGNEDTHRAQPHVFPPKTRCNGHGSRFPDFRIILQRRLPESRLDGRELSGFVALLSSDTVAGAVLASNRLPSCANARSIELASDCRDE